MKDFLQRFATKQADGTYAFSTVREGLIVALLSIGTSVSPITLAPMSFIMYCLHIGTLIGALLGAYIADWLGRRKAITVESGVFIIGVLIQVTCKSPCLTELNRFLNRGFIGSIQRLVSGRNWPISVRTRSRRVISCCSDRKCLSSRCKWPAYLRLRLYMYRSIKLR